MFVRDGLSFKCLHDFSGVVCVYVYLRSFCGCLHLVSLESTPAVQRCVSTCKCSLLKPSSKCTWIVKTRCEHVMLVLSCTNAECAN
jgi:hypothetical protein